MQRDQIWDKDESRAPSIFLATKHEIFWKQWNYPCLALLIGITCEKSLYLGVIFLLKFLHTKS